MAYYPILIDWQGVPCLVAGGGRIALHKAELLCAQGADVTVVAPEVCPEIEALPLHIERRKVRAEDAEGKLLVADASGSPEAEAVLREACREGHIPFVCAGHGEACTAILPAVHRKGRTVVAVSSVGASPAASAWLRDYLASRVPEKMDEILECMASLRPLSHEYFAEQPVRRRFLRRCLERMLEENRVLTGAEIEAARLETEEEERNER